MDNGGDPYLQMVQDKMVELFHENKQLKKQVADLQKRVEDSERRAIIAEQAASVFFDQAFKNREK
jgi:cell division septum initiation protein DivIVA